ncbi:hypothetical protein D1007_04418 [Hordeum vulgare]|nr:hypothetical protein D1007_04418 [Hordeum vulgare]
MHGIPSSIVFERDKLFTTNLWCELLAGKGTRVLYSTAYHPQTDGQSECINQCMEMYLRCVVHDALYGKDANLGAMTTWLAEAPTGDDMDWAAHTSLIRAQVERVQRRPCVKLSFKFFGTYTVLEMIGPLAYKLDLPGTSRVHPVFHISQLKSFMSDYTPVFAELPSVGGLSTSAMEPTMILERCMTKRGKVAVVQLKI